MIKTNIHQGKRYTFKTHINEILLPREKAEGIEAFLVIIEPGQFTHLHSHSDTEQLYYILSGRGEGVFRSSDQGLQKIEISPEDVLYIPRNTEHQIFCTGDNEPLRYLCVDGFPSGRPCDEPTWDDHYQAVVNFQKTL